MTVATFHANMRAAVRERLVSLAGMPVVAWEGRAFQPVKGTPYISESVRAVSSTVRALGVGGNIAHTVTASFRLHYPAGKGTQAIDATAGALLAHFRPGTVLAYSADSAVVQQAERTGNEIEPDWINATVIITFIGHTVN